MESLKIKVVAEFSGTAYPVGQVEIENPNPANVLLEMAGEIEKLGSLIALEVLAGDLS